MMFDSKLDFVFQVADGIIQVIFGSLSRRETPPFLSL